MFKQLYCLVALLFLPLCGLSHTLDNLNTSMVSVMDHSTRARTESFRAAMAKVLVKLSGNPEIATLPTIQTALNKASHFVKSYHFSTQHSEQPTPALSVTFDHSALVRLLKQSGQAIWGAERPLILIWSNINDQEDQYLLTAENENALEKDILSVAEFRGVPVLFPLMDLQEDTNNLVNNDNNDALSALQIRYNTQSILANNAHQEGNHWVVDWKFVNNGQTTTWGNQAPSLNDALKSGINQVADILANQQAIFDNSSLQNQYHIKINNIDNLQSLSQLINSIKNTAVIDNLIVTHMDDNAVELTVTTSVNPAILNNELIHQHTLLPMQTSEQANTTDTLAYRFRSSYSPTQPTTSPST